MKKYWSLDSNSSGYFGSRR